MTRDMEQGEWPLTHEAIAFDVDGRLIDGQHRLQAITNHGKPISMWICTDVAPDAARYIDNGAKRNLADSVKFFTGDEMNRRVEAATKAMADRRATYIFTRAEMWRFYLTHEDAIQFGVGLFASTPRRIANARVVATVCRAWYTADRKRLGQFAETMHDGRTFGPGDRAALMLRDELLTRAWEGLGDRRRGTLRIEYCLNKYMKRDARVGLRTVARKALFLIPEEEGFKAYKQDS